MKETIQKVVKEIKLGAFLELGLGCCLLATHLPKLLSAGQFDSLNSVASFSGSLLFAAFAVKLVDSAGMELFEANEGSVNTPSTSTKAHKM